jgi:hypothetical protein
MRRKMKRSLALVSLLTCLLMTVSIFAQQPDPLTGTWKGDWGPSARDRNPVTVQLKWDGKALTGTVNPDSGPIQLQKSTFNAGTGAVHMEAMAPGRGGSMYHYVIDGKLDKGAMTGSWNHDNVKGDFKITKQ